MTEIKIKRITKFDLNKAKEEIQKLNEADSMIFQTEKQIKEYGDKINADKLNKISDGLEKLKESHKNKDLKQIDEDLTSLNDLWQSASEEMYKAQAEAQQGGAADAEGQAEPANDTEDVQDVDFEEVK